MTDPGESMMWLRTVPDEKGAYWLTLELTDDISVTLTPEMAFAHSNYVLNRVASGVMQAKIVRQMTKLPGLDKAAVVQIIQDYRMDDVVPESPTAFSLRASVNTEGQPFFVVSVNDKEMGQWEMADALDHATHCLMSVHVADNDARYLRLLKGTVGLDDPTARRAVDALSEIDV